jgi:hypothetical protein
VSACQESGETGRAYIVPAPGSREPIATLLRSLGLDVDDEDGWLYFRLPRGTPPEVPERPRIDPAGPLPEVLARLSAAVAALRPRLDEVTTGIDHARIREARGQVEFAADVVEFALHRSVSSIQRPDRTLRPVGRLLRTGVYLAVLFPCVLVAALLSGGSLAWTAAAVVPGTILGALLANLTIDRLDRPLSRSRLATARSAAPPAGSADDAHAVLRPVGARLIPLRADITALRSAAGALLVRMLDGRDPATVTGADVLAAAERDRVFHLVLLAEEALAVAAYSLGVWREVSRG